MSSGSELRLSALDAVLDNQPVSDELAGDLFGVVDTLTANVALRRSLSDPGTAEEARKGLAQDVFGPHVSAAAVQVLASSTGQRWTGGRSFVDAIERQAVRAELRSADGRSDLSDTEDELFRFGRLVAGDHPLAAAIGDRSVPIANRQQLVEDLLAGKATSSTIVLAKRAVVARHRNFQTTLEDYVDVAAAEQARSVATVRVAKPLTEEQSTRLQAALSRQAGRDVVLQVIIDPDVIGGIRVEIGDEVVEGTTAGRIEDARRLFG